MGFVKALLGVAFLIGAIFVVLVVVLGFLIYDSNQRAAARAQAYERGRYQLALACGLSDMELETHSGPAEHFQCLIGFNGSDLSWNGQCGSAESGPEAWARCIVARYVKRCDFKLSHHAETFSNGQRIDMGLDECVGTQALKLRASN
jgi:hypothetical protein